MYVSCAPSVTHTVAEDGVAWLPAGIRRLYQKGTPVHILSTAGPAPKQRVARATISSAEPTTELASDTFVGWGRAAVEDIELYDGINEAAAKKVAVEYIVPLSTAGSGRPKSANLWNAVGQTTCVALSQLEPITAGMCVPPPPPRF